jgi:hypothetical protein
MERYNRDFNNLFDLRNCGLFLCCERVTEETVCWEKRHEDDFEWLFYG